MAWSPSNQLSHICTGPTRYVDFQNCCFGRTHTHVLFWGHWYPCLGFLVTSPLGFKVGSILLALWRQCNIYILRSPSGTTHYQPLDGQHCGVAI